MPDDMLQRSERFNTQHFFQKVKTLRPGPKLKGMMFNTKHCCDCDTDVASMVMKKKTFREVYYKKFLFVNSWIIKKIYSLKCDLSEMRSLNPFPYPLMYMILRAEDGLRNPDE
jgi:hypothetical protein